jgi:hypothetical protein
VRGFVKIGLAHFGRGFLGRGLRAQDAPGCARSIQWPMKTRLACLAVLAAGTVSAQTVPLSANAKQAIDEWHFCRDPQLPAGFMREGTRRFATSTLTWSAQPSMRVAARQTMALIQSYLTDPVTRKPILAIREVPYSEPAVQIRFRAGSFLEVPGFPRVPLARGCGPAPTMGADRLTYISAEIVCVNPADAGLSLLMHETWWHLLFSFCHTKSGLGAPSFATAAPAWEGVPGHREALRWIYTVPAGSFPP